MNDTIIIGAGPSGLALASQLKGTFKIIDMGKNFPERDRYDEEEALIGAGGAGLFSDGKFSFYPSGTEIWKLNGIWECYEALMEDIWKTGSTIQPNLSKDALKTTFDCEENQWNLKEYPSFYLTLKERMKLVQNYVEKIGTENILFETLCTDFTKHEEHYDVFLKRGNESWKLQSKRLVLAGGRFAPLFHLEPIVPKIFRRVEIGVRVVFPSSMDLPIHLTDPKFILKKKNYEFRTFCWCKEGEYVLTNFNNIRTYSGRADCLPTTQTNFGFNMRIKSENEIENKLTQDFLLYWKDTKPFEFQVAGKYLNKKFREYFGTHFGRLFYEGFQSFLKEHPEFMHEHVKVVGPTIEGIGCYPHIDIESMKISDENIYVIGDSSGIYRGIVPCMLSGYYLSKHLNKNIF